MTDYEFTEEQNKEILKLAMYMKITAILTIVFGALALIFTLLDFNLVSIVYFVFLIVAGISFYLPTDNFKRIAKTEGSDIKELIQGFKELSNFWTGIFILLVILLVLEFL